jgi:nitrate reductase (cytochrome), electron transfer subunit
MSTRDRRAGAGAPLTLFLVIAGVTAIAAGVVAVRREPASREPMRRLPSVPRAEAPATPITAEAEVFRTTPATLAIEPAAARERSAHPRRLTVLRYNRAYEGAPPRIPHGVSSEEFRTDQCRTCHQRGGYSRRFAAYVPLTPHAERGMCVQCHVGVDEVIGASGPAADPNRRCAICHPASGGTPSRDAEVTWPTTVWPAAPTTIAGRDPPPIPHDLPFRENCLTCHAGPAAAVEIRTAHPERLDCRGCHLARDTDATPFTRPLAGADTAAGSSP